MAEPYGLSRESVCRAEDGRGFTLVELLHLTDYHVNVYQMQPSLDSTEDEKLYTVPGLGPDNDAELLDLRGGWLDPGRYVENANFTQSTFLDSAGKPAQFFQANVEEVGYQNNFGQTGIQHSAVADQGHNNTLGTVEEPNPWAENQGHGDIIVSDAVHQFLIFHVQRALSA